MQSRIIIEGNSVYEVDEECTAEKEGTKEGKQRRTYEEKKKKSGCSRQNHGR